jgi:transcriptional regulator with XRE-family HTH domain
LSCGWQHGAVATRETPLARAKRRALKALVEFGAEVLEARVSAGISQKALGLTVGMSGTKIGRIEAGKLLTLSWRDASLIAAVLGLDVKVSLFPNGAKLRDEGHARRLASLLQHVARPLSDRTEVPLPQRPDQPTELRSWDSIIFGDRERTGVELEMRIRDAQAVERRITAKRRDDPVDHFLLAIADTRNNRAILADSPRLFPDLPRLKKGRVLRSLRAGNHPPTGLILI